MFALEFAVVVFFVFLAGVIREPRSFGNAVLLGLALALGALGIAEHLAGHAGAAGAPAAARTAACRGARAVPDRRASSWLNGVTMIRRESLRPGNLLSLLAGAAVFVVIGLDVAADRAGDVKLSLFATVANLVFGYVSFLLVSYVLYAFVYGLLARTGGADFVVVLGAGLRPDGGVPPLLANRLERGHEVWAALNRPEGLDRRAATSSRC